MRLPARGFHQFLGRSPARPFQQFEDPRRLAAVAWRRRCRSLLGIVEVMTFSPLAVITAVTTSITPVGRKRKRNLKVRRRVRLPLGQI
jgi:hypothetical protein